MHINFKTLILKNFLSFEEAQVDLSYSGYTLISGINKYKDDNAKSNGCGKSSIIEAIIWCLTGETLRGTKQIVNQFSEDGASVELLFNVDEKEYRIIRYKDDKIYGSNLKVFINNEDKSGKGIRDSEKLLKQYLPDLTSSLLGSVILLGQGLPHRFTNNTPAGRKEVLEVLSKSDFMIEDLKTKLTNRKIFLNNEIKDLRETLIADENQKVVYEERLLKLQQEKLTLKPIDSNYLDALKSNKAELVKNNSTIESEITSIKNNILTLKDTYNIIEKELDQQILNITTSYNEKEKLFIISQQEKKNQISNIKAEIFRLENIKDTCPTCKQKLPDVHIIDTTPLHNTLNSEEQKLTEIENQLAALNNQKQKEQELKKELYKDKLSSYQSQLTTLDKVLNTQENTYKESLDKIHELDLQIKSLEIQQETYINRINSIDIELKECQELVQNFSKKSLYNNNEKELKESRLEIVSKMLTIATREFRGVLLSEVINFINIKAKEYAQDVFDTDKIDFTLSGNDIDITYCNKLYENLSGGEKQKVDLIIQFSIRDMLIQFLGFSSNILMLDEIFDNLDDFGCQRVLDLITNKLTDVEGVYIITHHKDISIPYDRQLFVEKDTQGISRLN